MYDAQTSDSDLNLPAFLENVLASSNVRTSVTSKIKRPVLIGLFQSPAYLSHLEKEHAFGICVFGFKQCVPTDQKVNVIIDLSDMTSSPSLSNEQYSLGKSELMQLANSSSEHFRKNAPELSKQLEQTDFNIDFQNSGTVDVSSNLLSSLRERKIPLKELLTRLKYAERESLQNGRFVVSEPDITATWVSLAIFEKKLVERERQGELVEAVFQVIEGCVRGYNVNPEKISIVNLCTKDSGISNELSILWNIDKISKDIYDIPCSNVLFDEKDKTVVLQDEDEFSERDVILLVPLDSYAGLIGLVLNHLRKLHSNVILIISLFSISKYWSYLTPSDFFDVAWLFRVESDLQDPFQINLRLITESTKHQVLRPTLFNRAT